MQQTSGVVSGVEAKRQTFFASSVFSVWMVTCEKERVACWLMYDDPAVAYYNSASDLSVGYKLQFHVAHFCFTSSFQSSVLCKEDIQTLCRFNFDVPDTSTTLPVHLTSVDDLSRWWSSSLQSCDGHSL